MFYYLLVSLLSVPIILGNIFLLVSMVTAYLFFRKSKYTVVLSPEDADWPSVSLLKPLCGVEKDLFKNLVSCVDQDYPDYEIIFSFHHFDDSALPIAKKVMADYPNRKIKIVVDSYQIGTNGKVNNLYNAYQASTGRVVVISDSDIVLKPDYLKKIVSPLRDSKVGLAGTLFRAISADHFFEKLELLTFNAEHIPSVIASTLLRLVRANLGPSYAIRREVLDQVGGFAAISLDLAEDYRLAVNVRKAGYQTLLINEWVDMRVDLKDFKHWFRHQLYWNWCTRSASPIGYVLSYAFRCVPAAFLLLLIFKLNWFGLGLFVLTLGLRSMSYLVINGLFLKEDRLLENLLLLPIRDLIGLGFWVLAFFKRGIRWKEKHFVVKQGKLVQI